MPYYSAHTTCGRLVNRLRDLLDARNMSSFKLSRISEVSPTTMRSIYHDEHYIPSPDVLEKICLVLDIQPGDLLSIAPTMDSSVVVCSGV